MTTETYGTNTQKALLRVKENITSLQKQKDGSYNLKQGSILFVGRNPLDVSPRILEAMFEKSTGIVHSEYLERSIIEGTLKPFVLNIGVDEGLVAILTYLYPPNRPTITFNKSYGAYETTEMTIQSSNYAIKLSGSLISEASNYPTMQILFDAPVSQSIKLMPQGLEPINIKLRR